MKITDILSDPMAVIEGRPTVSDRQDEQWQLANKALDSAGAMLTFDEPDYQAVIATALVGLLSLQISRT